MTTFPAIQMTKQGLFLPRQLFMTARFKGFVHPHIPVEKLHQDYESSLLEGAAL